MSDQNRPGGGSPSGGGHGGGGQGHGQGGQGKGAGQGGHGGQGHGQGGQGGQGKGGGRGNGGGQGQTQATGKGSGKRAARDRLAQQREQQQRADRRRRGSGIAIMVVVALVVVGIIGYAWYASNDSGPDNAALPALVQEPGGGVVVGDGPVDVTVWEDFQCPFCADFEAQNGDMLRQRVDDGDITLTIHPLSFLDAKLGNSSSALAANAFGCVTDAGEQQALDYHLTLYANQPEENPGQEAWTADQLIGWGNDVGVEGSDFEDCVNSGTYDGWVTQVQSTMGDEGITATPTVFVDGEPFKIGTDDLEATIDDALKSNQ